MSYKFLPGGGGISTTGIIFDVTSPLSYRCSFSPSRTKNEVGLDAEENAGLDECSSGNTVSVPDPIRAENVTPTSPSSRPLSFLVMAQEYPTNQGKIDFIHINLQI